MEVIHICNRACLFFVGIMMLKKGDVVANRNDDF